MQLQYSYLPNNNLDKNIHSTLFPYPVADLGGDASPHQPKHNMHPAYV